MPKRIMMATLKHLPEADYRAQDKKFLNSAAWRNFRAAVLARDPVCQITIIKPHESCEYPSTDCHHIRKRRQYPFLALSYGNVIGLCHEHHLLLKSNEK